MPKLKNILAAIRMARINRRSKSSHDHEAEYDRQVASGEIQFLDFHGLTVAGARGSRWS